MNIRSIFAGFVERLNKLRRNGEYRLYMEARNRLDKGIDEAMKAVKETVGES